MDEKRVENIALQCLTALETVSVVGQHNRTQLSGIYRGLKMILEEISKEVSADGRS